MSEIKVNSIKGVSATSAAITINNTDGSCTANLTNRTNKNLVINGACLIAQRGTSETGSAANGYATVDRFRTDQNGTDAYIEQHQVNVASGTTPYTEGFRKAFQVKNGNQSSGAGTNDRVIILHRIEGQDLANSGWNYTSASSYVSFSFWVKSSVAQNFYVTFKSGDGTPQKYAMETGSLSANTWAKITKTIPGNSNIQFDNDNGEGLEIEWSLFRGTDMTGSMSLNAWAANNNSVRTPDQTSTWYTTDDATFEITGVQLEVSDHATSFEHRSFAQELALCQRYFEIGVHGNYGNVTGGGTHKFYSQFKTQKRATPTLAIISSQENYVSSVSITADPSDATLGCRIQGAVSATGDNKYMDAKFSSDAEL
tara:strand:- start:261 stop:1367 length:1107 start_codon:yes stop_codon:yes gene_type:complete